MRLRKGRYSIAARIGMSAFSYGQSQARNHAHVATWACHLGTLETSIDAFLAKVVAAMQSEGGTPTRLVREEER